MHIVLRPNLGNDSTNILRPVHLRPRCTSNEFLGKLEKVHLGHLRPLYNRNFVREGGNFPFSDFAEPWMDKRAGCA